MEMTHVSPTMSSVKLWQQLGYKCRLTQHKGDGYEKPVYIDIPNDRLHDVPFIKSEFEKAFVELERSVCEVREIIDDIKAMLANAGFN